MRNNTSEIEGLENFLSNQVSISIEQTTATTYNVFIDEEIKEPSYYRNLYNVLGNATELDTVVFHLCTEGGLIDPAVTICNLIDSTDAHTVAILEGEVCSAGTLIVMACDSVIALPHSSMMIHAAVYGTGGSMNKVKRYVDFTDAHLRKILETFYKGFLSDQEIQEMIVNQKEFWITGEEVIQRLENRDKAENESSLIKDIVVEPPKPAKKKSSKKPFKEE